MVNEKVLTIVIPSYNTEKYIRDNIKTMTDCRHLDRLEILFINDGSKDRTAEIASEYEKKYPGIIRLVNKENGGHGSVINRGIQEATGKYFKVIDGDDYVDSDSLDRLVEQLAQTDVDVCVSDYYRISAVTHTVTHVSALKKDGNTYAYNTLYPIDSVLPNLEATIHGLTYRTQMLKDHYEQIRFSEKIFYEDNEYRLFPMIFASTALVSDSSVYYYVVDQANQSVSVVNQQKRIGQLITVARRMLAFYNEHFAHSAEYGKKQYAQFLISGVVYAVFEVYLTYSENLSVRKKELMQFDAEVKQSSVQIYQTAAGNRMIRLLRQSNFTLYRPMNVVLRWKISRKKGK